MQHVRSHAGRLSLSVLTLAALLCAPETFAQTLFHGASIQKNPAGPSGLPKAHVGENITAAIRVRNVDDFNDSLTITSIVDIVHHGTGDTRSANLLLAPVNLPSFGNSVTVTNVYPVVPGDPDILTDDAEAGGIDNHDGDGGSQLKQDFFVSFPGQIRVVKPCVRVQKSCANGIGENGQIVWVGTVANCGNSTLTNVVVSNLVYGVLSRVFGPATLTNGQSASFTNSYPGDCTPTTDTLFAYGTDELNLTVSHSATATCSNIITTGISVTKNCPGAPVQPGALLAFSGVVSNTGNITLTNVVVLNDRPAPGTVVFGPVSLAPGESRAFTGSYTTPTSSCGPWIDTLTAIGINRCGERVTNTATATCPSATTAALVIKKFCPPAPTAPGSLLVFSGWVSNSGNVTLTNVLVVNNRPSNGTPVLGPITLAPGQVRFFTNSYRTAADSCGPWVDTLSATGRSLCGSNANSSATAICPVTTNPRISITKECPPTATPAGGVLVYSGVVSNSGNVTLTDVFVVDNKPTNNTPVLGPITLAPGQSARFTNSYVVPGEECCGPYVDTLTATGLDRCTGARVTKTSTAVCPAFQSPALCITRTCPAPPITPNQPVAYSGIVSNCSNVALSNVVVIDHAGQVIMSMQGFNIGEWMDYSGTFTPTNCGPSVTNVITISGHNICNGVRVSATAVCVLDCGAAPLVIIGPTLVRTKYGFSFQSLPGKSYTVEWIDSLTPPLTGWQTLSNLNGDGSLLHIEDSMGQPQRYYRVIQNP